MKFIQKIIKFLFPHTPIDFIEYLCMKTHLDSQVRLIISNTMREIHRNGYISMQDYIQFLELGISFGQGFKDKVFENRVSYQKVINKLMWLTDNKYTKEDIEKSCGIILTSKY